MHPSVSRITPWLLAFGLLAAAVLIYLGVSLTSSDPLLDSAGAVPSGSATLVFSGWSDSGWQEALDRPCLVLLLVGDSLLPRSMEAESMLQSDASLRSVITTRFLPVRTDRRIRPDLAERYAENQVPHLSVLLPTGEALARITGDPDSWSEQLVETERYWRDHQDEIRDRAEAFWSEQEADSLALPAGIPQLSDLDVIDSAVALFTRALLASEAPGPALWRTDLDSYLSARRSAWADSLWRALRASRTRHIGELQDSLLPEATPAEWARTVTELELYAGVETTDELLWAVDRWFARQGGPVTAEETAWTQRLASLLGRELAPSYPGTWLGLDSGSTASLPHLRHGRSDLDGSLMDALAWLELCVESGDAGLTTTAQRLGDSLWARLWDPTRRALRDKPTPPGGRRESRVHPMAQLGRAASLFDRLAGLTGETRFKARADSCLCAFAPFVGQAGVAATYYGEALLLRTQPDDRGGFPARAPNPQAAGTP